MCQKQLRGNLAQVNLKLKKLNYLLRVQPNFIALAFLTLEVACLTFRPFLTLNPEQLGCLLKKTFTPKKTSRVLTFFSSVFGLYLLVRFFQPTVNKVKK